MRVLVLEDQNGRAAEAELRLRIAGHATVSCADPITGAPCRACVGGVCPLDGDGVDAVVFALDDEDRPLPVGLPCAARRHVPGLCLPPPGVPVDLVTAVEQVSHLVPPGHGAVALGAVREVLDAHGHRDVGASVVVERERNRLHLEVETDQPLDMGLRRLAAQRAGAAVRQLDPAARRVTVTVS